MIKRPARASNGRQYPLNIYSCLRAWVWEPLIPVQLLLPTSPLPPPPLLPFYSSSTFSSFPSWSSSLHLLTLHILLLTWFLPKIVWYLSSIWLFDLFSGRRELLFIVNKWLDGVTGIEKFQMVQKIPFFYIGFTFHLQNRIVWIALNTFLLFFLLKIVQFQIFKGYQEGSEFYFFRAWILVNFF